MWDYADEIRRNRLHNEKMQAIRLASELSMLDMDYRPSLIKSKIKMLEIIDTNRYLGINHVQIIACGNGGHYCQRCAEHDRMTMPLDEEMSSPKLPIPDCQCVGYHAHQTGYCLCYYEIVFDDEI